MSCFWSLCARVLDGGEEQEEGEKGSGKLELRRNRAFLFFLLWCVPFTLTFCIIAEGLLKKPFLTLSTKPWKQCITARNRLKAAP